MACFVTGITPTADVSALESMLDNVSGIDKSKLSVITTATKTPEHERSSINFVHAGGGHIDSDSVGGVAGGSYGIMTSSGGTSVPGMSSPQSRLGHLGTSHVMRQLGNLPIPRDEIDNYNYALDDGRCVVAYECTGAETSDVERAFRDAGVRRVRTFRG